MLARTGLIALTFLLAVGAATAATDATLAYGGRNLGLGIPDNDPNGLAYTINVPDSFPIADLNVDIRLNHELLPDLRITVEDPDGEIVTLYTGNCGGEENLSIIFDDEGRALRDCEWINDGRTISPASIVAFPAGMALGRYDGKDAQGAWTIRVIDEAAEDVGALSTAVLLFQEDTSLSEIAAVQADLDTLTQDVADLATQVSTVEDKVDQVQSDVDIVQGQLLTLQNSVNQVQADVTMIKDQLALQDQLEIEKALLGREFTSMLTAPSPFGKLEDVRDVVFAAIATMQGIGESTLNAESMYTMAENDRLAGRYRKAIRRYAVAFCIAVSETNEIGGCY